MRLLSSKNLIGLAVYTKSEQYLGKIRGFEIDPVSHAILKYHIQSSSLLKKLFQPKLIIDSKQVISLNREKMVVEDGVVRESEPVIVPVSPQT